MMHSSDTLDRSFAIGRSVSSTVVVRPSFGPAPLGPGAGQFQSSVFRLESLLESRQALQENDASPEVLLALRNHIVLEVSRLQQEGVLPQDLQSTDSEDVELRLHKLWKYLRFRRSEQYRVLAECSVENPNPILRVGLGGNVLDANRSGHAFHDALTDHVGGNPTEWFRRLIAKVIDRHCSTLIELQCGGRNFALTFAPVTDAAYVYVYGFDVSSLREASRITETLAMQDALTGLPNRVYLRLRFDHAVDDCQRKGCALSVAFLDLDHFKQVNDTYGHAVGDRTLKAIAHSINESLGHKSVVARWGGDEFVVLFPELKRRHAANKCERLIDQVAQRAAREVGCLVTLSYGIASFPADGRNLEELLHEADQNLLQAKKERSCNRTAPKKG